MVFQRPLLFSNINIAHRLFIILYVCVISASAAPSSSHSQLVANSLPASRNSSFRHNRTASISILNSTANTSKCSNEEIEWENDGNCYPRSDQGPCGNNMIIVPSHEDREKGRCVCGFSLSRNQTRVLIYNVRFDQCYEIYTKGPCSSDRWLVIKNEKPACDTNPCLSFTHYSNFENREFVPFKGECVELFKASSLCSKAQVVSFSRIKGHQFKLICSSKFGVQAMSLAPPNVSCPAGQALDITQKCTNIVELDFDL